MPIFDQGYQHWQGKLSGHAWRWLTIARQGARLQFKNRYVRAVLLLALVPALILGTFMVFWGLLEQEANAAFLESLVRMFGLPDAIRNAPKEYRNPVWTIAYEYFFRVELYVSLGLVLLVGPGLISKDLRFNAMPLYFSKPLRRFDYFAGKLAVIGICLGAVVIVPALIAYVLGVCFSLDLSIVSATIRIVAASVLYGLIVVVSAGTLMLAFSSLSRNSRYVAVMWAGFWIISGTLGTALTETIRDDWCAIISYRENLERLGNWLLDTDSAYKKLAGVTQVIQRPKQQPPRVVRGRKMQQAPPEPMDNRSFDGQRGRPAEPNPPWYWSAGVLAGLFGLSLCILTTRVKSLDRLR
jgi:ABC-2 type transport system permease protein